MKKSILALSLVLVAGIAFADTPKPADKATEKATTEKSADKATGEKAAKHMAAKTHPVEAEVVSADVEKKTITVKAGEKEMTAPVEGKAVASLKDVKAGEKVVLTCRDNDKGEHEAVTAIVAAKAPKAPAATKTSSK